MNDVMIYSDAEWPHGARCSRCGELFTEGQVMAEELDGFQVEHPVVTVAHVLCESPPTSPDTSVDREGE